MWCNFPASACRDLRFTASFTFKPPEDFLQKKKKENSCPFLVVFLPSGRSESELNIKFNKSNKSFLFNFLKIVTSNKTLLLKCPFFCFPFFDPSLAEICFSCVDKD